MSAEHMQVQHEESVGGGRITLSGPLSVQEVGALETALGQVPGGDVSADLAEVTRMDTAGAWALIAFEQRVAKAGGTVRFENASETATLLLETVRSAMPQPDAADPAPHGPKAFLEATGKRVIGGFAFLRGLLAYLGLFLAGLLRVITHPREFRFTSLVAHCDDVGLRAVPIVSLMAFLIGVVLAFQGASQLRQFGAEVFVVDLIAISVLRELGILLTAIIVAGRTASAFTAAIGSMKMRQEIDAMRTLGLDPVTVLFVPRILALLLMLPILGLVADIMGLFGGALMSWIELGISPSMFRTRLIEGTDVSHVIVGLVKAPVFALIIGVVGCHAGMQVKGDAESLGRMTSSAVVTAIFAVIVADALFSVFFAELGL
ncbi:ABC transporter permease [Alloyangia pacifica]|uniref:ABC transporter permease n=1 Tax=Alloyangia pacifica TaxID=311180 RepID=UPI001CD47938|nr:MlaE family lipid ABC transporter permease subunit [Alloyangia pacifica]MCA0996734.1 MlaE family lipid ABC transporter permease subunit [Alloyangia pacifica]